MKTHFRFSGIVLFFLITTLIPVVSFGQSKNSKFINVSDYSTLKFSGKELEKVEMYKHERITKNVNGIAFGKISQLARSEKGELPIQLPGDKTDRIASPTRFEYHSDDNYSWSGKFTDKSGDIAIVCKDGLYAGRIESNNKLYEIRSLRKGRNVIVEFDGANFAYDQDLPDPIEVGPDTIAIPNPGGSTMIGIDVLVLYTPNANAYYNGSIASFASFAMDQLQSALTQSLSIPNVYVNQVGLVQFSLAMNPAYPMNDYLSQLRENTTVQSLRNQYHADLVVMLSQAGFTDVRGCAFVGPNNDYAYAMVEVPYATLTYSFTHEVGHLFGCLHGSTQEAIGTYNHGSIFIGSDNNTYRTVMCTATPSLIYQRINLYSNPEKTYMGFPTGETDSNNALWIYNHAPTVAAFQTVQSLSVAISTAFNGSVCTFTASSQGGIAPITYQWASSPNGIDYTYRGSGSTFTVELGSENSDIFYARVIATSSDNQTGTGYCEVHLDAPYGSNNNLTAEENLTSSVRTDNKLSGKVQIFPNPITESTTIHYEVALSSPVEIKLLDITGRVMSTVVDGYQQAGTYNKKLDASNLKPGIYFCSFRIGSDTIVEKVLIQ